MILNQIVHHVLELFEYGIDKTSEYILKRIAIVLMKLMEWMCLGMAYTLYGFQEYANEDDIKTLLHASQKLSKQGQMSYATKLSTSLSVVCNKEVGLKRPLLEDAKMQVQIRSKHARLSGL